MLMSLRLMLLSDPSGANLTDLTVTEEEKKEKATVRSAPDGSDN